ncbi:hypothetical protein BDZ85DRAFT_286058 [Elsinoe ampelina]|uniref:Uncharacterized protein n=1 Tax=Elsinoe ampelina TaxID=302913 RepID=A0A6A6FZG1_9PEZI|nr:hypothetical protein BDZ85DRAFT_286058 [Elsinoe ampelina]
MSPLTQAATSAQASTMTTPLTSTPSPTSSLATPERPGARNDTTLFAILFGIVLAVLLGVTYLWCRARKTSTLLSTQLRRLGTSAPDALDTAAEQEGHRGRHPTARRAAAFRVYPPGSGLSMSAPELIVLSAEGVREGGEWERRGRAEVGGGVGDGVGDGGSAGVEGGERSGVNGTDEVDWAVERRDTPVAGGGRGSGRELGGETLETIQEERRLCG